MFLSHIFSLLAVVIARPSDRPADVKDVFPSRRLWDHLYKEAKKAPTDKVLQYESILNQCRVETTDDNYRVILYADDASDDELEVVLKDNFLILARTGYEVFHDMTESKKVVNKFTFTEVRSVPAQVVPSLARAELTDDGFLVVNLPIHAQAVPTQGEWKLPVVRSKTPLVEGKTVNFPTAMGQMMHPRYSLHWLYKLWARRLKIESQLEHTEERFRIIVKVINAMNIKKDDVRVEINDGILFMATNFSSESVPTKNLFCDSYILPPSSVVDSINATVTKDGYLIVDVPLDPADLFLVTEGNKAVPVKEYQGTLERWKASYGRILQLVSNESEGDGVSEATS